MFLRPPGVFWRRQIWRFSQNYKGLGVIPCEKDNFGSDHLKNQLFGPKQVSYTPLGASGPFLTLKSHFSVKI